MKKIKIILSVLLILSMLFTLIGCGAKTSMDKAIDGYGPVGDGVDASFAGGLKSEEEMADVVVTGVPASEEKSDEAVNNIQIGAGMLTAGEWDDLENLDFWKNLLNNNDWYALMEARSLFARNIIRVHLTDADGSDCFGVSVDLVNSNGKTIYSAVSDVYGMAYLLYDLDNKNEEYKSIRIGSSEYEVEKDVINEIKIDDSGLDIEKLDLMFVIDTTGSMSDEIQYLQAELRDIIRRVSQNVYQYDENGEKKSNTPIAINLSVNFYRDAGDTYVVKSNQFSSDIEKQISLLNKEQADGGGDYPEAVHRALKDAVQQHQWRKDAVKLCFMVLDAPPHNENEIKGIDAFLRESIVEMAENGIRFIPVASSGVDRETEFLLRSWAVMTGGTYTFLTNHSGIGGDHLEPTIGEYEVEKLNDLLVRVVSEYCGIKTTTAKVN